MDPVRLLEDELLFGAMSCSYKKCCSEASNEACNDAAVTVSLKAFAVKGVPFVWCTALSISSLFAAAECLLSHACAEFLYRSSRCFCRDVSLVCAFCCGATSLFETDESDGVPNKRSDRQ